ncbi:MAG: MFS transporter [Planctomycetaceae bacterium]|nr:MFS transporter [Planctomycetaceae bacterium]
MSTNFSRLPRGVWVLCLGTFVNRAGAFVVLFMTIYLTEELHLTAQTATTAVGLFGVGSLVAMLCGGQLADQWGRKNTMLLSLIASGLIILWMSTLREPAFFLGAIFLFSLFSDLYRPASSALIGDLCDTETRPLAFSLIYVAANLGFSVAPPLGGWLAAHSFQLLYYVDTVTTLSYAVLIFLLIADPPRLRVPGDHRWGEQIQAYRRIVRDGPFLLICLATMLGSGVYLQSMSTLPLYMREIGYSKAEYGTLIAINGVQIVLLQIPLTKFFGRYRPLANVSVASLLIGIGFAILPLGTGVMLIISSIVIWTFGEILQAAFLQAVVAKLAPVDLRGRYMGVFGLSFALSLALGAPIGGYVMDHFGPNVLWLGCLGICTVSAAIYWQVDRSGATDRIADGVGQTTAEEDVEASSCDAYELTSA